LHEYNLPYDDREAENLPPGNDAVHLYESGLAPDPFAVVPASGNVFPPPDCINPAAPYIPTRHRKRPGAAF
jgi:hypothetical protein